MKSKSYIQINPKLIVWNLINRTVKKRARALTKHFGNKVKFTSAHAIMGRFNKIGSIDMKTMLNQAPKLAQKRAFFEIFKPIIWAQLLCAYGNCPCTKSLPLELSIQKKNSVNFWYMGNCHRSSYFETSKKGNSFLDKS